MAATAAAKRPCCWPPAAAAAAEPNKRHRTAGAAAPMDGDFVTADDAAAAVQSQGQPQPKQPLLPGLPDHLAQLCLSPLQPRLMQAVCRPWRRLLYSPSFPPFLSLYAVLDDADGGVSFSAYDTVAGRWDELPPPPMPSPPPKLWHPSFLSRRLPLQSVAAAGRLVLVAGSTQSLHPALSRPVVFDPAAPTPRWQLGPRFPFAPRRWCAAGAARGRVFIAGGVGAGYDANDARSGAVWDPAAPSAPWEPLPPLRDGRFSRDAAEAVCSGGKVCMVSLRGSGAKEGAVFDLRAARWEDMPPGMVAGWKGPAAAASSDSSDETIYVVDEERGALIAYDWATDRWRTVAESERLKGAAEMAVGGGRVCMVAGGGEKVIVVDVTPKAGRGSAAPRMWEVAAPAGKRVVALHVLPRMTRAE
ncbi:F-box/kelch-repeat protein SKIP25-like [Phragmites australis]|uniref:F-box/kelch-repeat protein SKIP25-like n=1 Tax=Phragmites australis TaxID=29695 RepID=UPI002D77C7E3|nr:F-box/kelch-repeat protein SKIP25-like [Phragmites australis]